MFRRKTTASTGDSKKATRSGMASPRGIASTDPDSRATLGAAKACAISRPTSSAR
jgi:hypothetical protein